LLAIFLVGMIEWLILDQQALRHRTGLRNAYERLGIPAPPAKPGIPQLEAVLNIVLGLILAGISAMMFLNLMANLPPHDATEVWTQAPAILGTGVAMIVLGVRGMRDHPPQDRNRTKNVLTASKSRSMRG